MAAVLFKIIIVEFAAYDLFDFGFFGHEVAVGDAVHDAVFGDSYGWVFSFGASGEVLFWCSYAVEDTEEGVGVEGDPG